MRTKTAKGPGRPSVVGKVIDSNIIQFKNKTPKEFVAWIFPKVQEKMKGGVTNDPKVVKSQKVSLYQTVLKRYNNALANHKNVEYRGKLVGSVLKKKWIRSSNI